MIVRFAMPPPNARKDNMKLRIALTTVLWISTTTAAMAFDVADMDPPALVHGLDKASGIGCKAVRAKKNAELAPPWRSAITAISMTCEPMEGLNKEPDAGTVAVAKLRPGAATLQGIPVVELRQSSSWAHDDSQYVLGAAYPEVVNLLGAYIRARCLARAGSQAPTENLCAIAPDAQHGGIYVNTSELGGTWLHPDPRDPRRSVLAEASSE